MNPIGTITPSVSPLQPGQVGVPFGTPFVPTGDTNAAQAASGGFAQMLDGLVSSVDAKQAQSTAITNKVLLGDSDQLHQSVIAMQEATTALSLMVQVRNKLVESYQELMRMQV
jgi:flagellar hook-basal body complex protein FliE